VGRGRRLFSVMGFAMNMQLHIFPIFGSRSTDTVSPFCFLWGESGSALLSFTEPEIRLPRIRQHLDMIFTRVHIICLHPMG